VRSVQWLQDFLQREKNPGWQWFYRQFRYVKKILATVRNKFVGPRASNPDTCTDFSLATEVHNNKELDAAGNAAGKAISVSRTTAIGTATPPRCPMQTL
jgi:hypothetical protein